MELDPDGRSLKGLVLELRQAAVTSRQRANLHCMHAGIELILQQSLARLLQPHDWVRFMIKRTRRPRPGKDQKAPRPRSRSQRHFTPQSQKPQPTTVPYHTIPVAASHRLDAACPQVSSRSQEMLLCTLFASALLQKLDPEYYVPKFRWRFGIVVWCSVLGLV